MHNAPTSANVSATTDNGTFVTLQVSGNIAGSQMSNVTITSDQSTATTTLSFTLSRETRTTGSSNITIPKISVLYGATPIIYIDSQPAQNQGYAEDTNNYYVWFTIQFSAHKISIVFTATPTPTPSATPNPTASPNVKESQSMPQEVIYTIVAVTAIVAITCLQHFC